MFSRIQTHLKTNLGDFYDRALLCLLLVSFILRIAWLDVPAGSLIFDEWYYVNVARNILGIPQSLGGGGIPPYQNAIIGVDPNHEHPPLAKLMIALSTWLFGNNGYGFRLPSVIFGTLSILVFYLLLKELSRNNSLSFLASFLFSFDNLIFVHSRIATLDIFGLFFMILGFYLYFRKKTALSGVAFALSVLCKFGGLFGIFAVIAYHIGKILFSKRFAGMLVRSLEELEKLIIAFSVSFIGLLLILDRLWGGYMSPMEHVAFILNYTKALVTPYPTGIMSYPWQWLLNQVQIPYLKVDVNQMVNGQVVGSFSSVYFNGAMNPLIIFLTIPSMLYATYLFIKRRDDLSLLVIVWFTATYFPFIPMAIFWHRVMYLFYFINTLPAVCIAVAVMVLDARPPKIVLMLYLLAVVGMFVMMFPFRTIP